MRSVRGRVIIFGFGYRYMPPLGAVCLQGQCAKCAGLYKIAKMKCGVTGYLRLLR